MQSNHYGNRLHPVRKDTNPWPDVISAIDSYTAETNKTKTRNSVDVVDMFIDLRASLAHSPAAVALIEQSLPRFSGQDQVSSNRVVDVLLDLRNLCGSLTPVG